MLSEDQRREIAAVALLAVALLFFLSLLPVTVLGSAGEEWFPSGNMIGVLGGTLRGLLVAFVGVSAVLVPLLLAVAGLRAGDWLSPDRSLRLVVLFTGLLFLIPLLAWITAESPAVAGWLGTSLGSPLVGLVGELGGLLITGVLFVALSVATLSWNPLRSVGRGVKAGGDVAGRTAKVLADKGKELAEARAKALAEQREQAAVAEEEAPVEGFEPEWMEGAERDDQWDGEFAESEAAGASVNSGAAGLATDASAESVGGADGDASKGTDGKVLDDAGGDASAQKTDGADTAAGEGATVADDPSRESVDDRHEDDLDDPNAESAIEHEVPPVDLLSAPETQDRASMERQLEQLGDVLVEKLRTFNIESEVRGRTTGPVVTQFEVVPAPGVKVNRIANLDADLALAMKARTIRIVAPIPGKGAVGVEIPNPSPEIVNLREILETPEFHRAKGVLPLALGKDLNGRPYVSALEKMPHVLIAGATGSGKSVCLNTIITSLVYRHTPETLRLLMIDPKMVELSVYSKLPHLRHNVITDPRDAAGVLKWAVLEMERRYALLKANTVRSIQEFNKKVREDQIMKRAEPKGREGDENRWIYDDGIMPYIVVVVDELADLMMTVQSEVEKPLTQLAQKARAIGIHLIVATQRPSVNVITGLIKANFPTRIAFRVASKTDSRTILDQNGADALLGNGDMLFLPPGGSTPVRIQGAYLPTEDTERLMGWYADLLERHAEEAEEAPATDEPDIFDELKSQEMEDASAVLEEIAGDWDELFRAAAEVCIMNEGGSTSLLQRKLSIGYGRAARIADQLQDAGVLGPSEGAKGREVLITLDELDDICGPG